MRTSTRPSAPIDESLEDGAARMRTRNKMRKARHAVPIAIALLLALAPALPGYLEGVADPGTETTDAPTTDTTGRAGEDEASYSTWSEKESPNYVRLVGKAQVEDPLEPGDVSYSPLDDVGRAGQVRACITARMVEAGSSRERSDSLPDPSGWPTQNLVADIVLPTGETYHGWFWNRCHLLAKSLGGSDELENLVCGTRMFNVGANDGQGGMDLFETAIRDWLETYPDVTVQYVATPCYEGDELVPRSIVVDVLSSDGELNERLEVYNAAKGYEIDYADGSVSPS